jgi:hypothetical protein
VRWLVALVALTGLAYAGPPSNPAFLGISMEDARYRTAHDGCRVIEVTQMSAAEAAGLHREDVIEALDGVTTASCTQLTAEIIAHAPGDVVKLDVLRGADKIAVKATLSTRAEILSRRLVGRALDSIDAVDVDTKAELDLAELRGDTTVLAWFDVHRCGDCVGLIRRLADVVQAPRKTGNVPRLLAVTFGSATDLANVHTTQSLGVPLAVVDQRAFETSATNDGDRLFVMVLDRRGHVCFVTPIAPQDDSLDAAIDEVLAAAEQAEHARAARR